MRKLSGDSRAAERGGRSAGIASFLDQGQGPGVWRHLDATTDSLHVSCENVEVTQTFIYLGSVIHSSTSCELEINRRLGRAWSAMNSLDEGVWRCRYLCKRTKVRVFRSLVLPVLLYFCETWTLTAELRRRLNSFGTMSLRRILGYRWHDYMSNTHWYSGRLV